MKKMISWFDVGAMLLIGMTLLIVNKQYAKNQIKRQKELWNIKFSVENGRRAAISMGIVLVLLALWNALKLWGFDKAFKG